MPDPIEKLTPEERLEDEFGDKSEEEFEGENEEIGRKVIDKLYPELDRKIEEFNQRLETLNKNIDVTIKSRLQLDELEAKYNKLEAETVRGDDARLRRLEKIVEEQRNNIGKEKRSSRDKARTRIVKVLLGLTVAVGVATFLFIYIKGKEPEPSDKFTSDDVKTAKEIVERWRNLPDAEMWQSIADYADQYKPSLETQMLMMGYIKNWADNPSFKWEWEAIEKYEHIQQLEESYAKEEKSSEIYCTVASMTYKGNPLPRGIAADICELALADIIAARQQSDNSK
ncbi:hypothetical protein [Coleofasciculus sp.]|uniref:hypothetical protein n=1 Tax=Coleofasciculus sp. TaxID=3100458 RepID=UPI003A1F47FF